MSSAKIFVAGATGNIIASFLRFENGRAAEGGHTTTERYLAECVGASALVVYAEREFVSLAMFNRRVGTETYTTEPIGGYEHGGSDVGTREEPRGAGR